MSHFIFQQSRTAHFFALCVPSLMFILSLCSSLTILLLDSNYSSFKIHFMSSPSWCPQTQWGVYRSYCVSMLHYKLFCPAFSHWVELLEEETVPYSPWYPHTWHETWHSVPLTWLSVTHYCLSLLRYKSLRLERQLFQADRTVKLPDSSQQE